ncbi:MAG: glycoside hydrolase family 9 protein [Clostridiales bacterium]|jgi:hypothetical protein|nr:glycoside hydrolase family 9 protein [Clostridiales bacterium]
MVFKTNEDMNAKLIESGYLHSPLPLERENSLEQTGLTKQVLKQRVLCDMQDISGWTAEGIGTAAHDGEVTPLGHTALRLQLPTVMPNWPESQPDGDYVPFGHGVAVFNVKNEDWTEYNRVHFWLRPDCPGARTVNIALIYANDGAEKIPDAYNREGYHEVNLINRQWNECFLEIPNLPRDCITRIGFESAAFGKDRATGEYLRFDIGEITLQEVAEPEIDEGWLPGNNTIVYSMTGYFSKGGKTAIMRSDDENAAAFSLWDAENKKVYENSVKPVKSRLGDFNLLDFTDFEREGEYTLHCGKVSTQPFSVGEDIWTNSVWKVLNFIFCERCGCPVSEKHGSCHGDILAEHNGAALAFNGGWHDAGDMSQQTLQTGDVLYSLLELASKVKGQDTLLYKRLIEEAEWGLDFILKCRFGGGYRASSAGIVHWSDGFIGSYDDRPARAQNNSFDNFLYAVCESYAARILPDKMLCEKLKSVAAEDFDFAIEKFRKDGFGGLPFYWEHSYPTSESQEMAALAWAAGEMYVLTGEERYAAEAVNAINYVLECQCVNPVGEAKIEGFFYRNTDKKVIQHANHQSREQLYMQALKTLLIALPNHPSAAKWLEAVKRYGNYLKQAAAFTAPYGMLPAGLYRLDEVNDKESFNRQHLFAGENAQKDYIEQLKQGAAIDAEHYFKIFPVWFSFRGNSAVHLSMGKAAAICAGILNDRELSGIAAEQLYWVVGKNPFGQSLIYGEGYRYAEQAVYLPGTMTGQIPVGVQTKGNRDIPYWPQANNATYKEAWLTSAGKWFSLLAEMGD